MRNISTFSNLLAQQERECSDGNVTLQGQLMKKKEKICSLQTIAMGIGLSQLLEKYAEVSITVLSAKMYVVSSLKVLRGLETFLKEIQNWSCAETELPLS